MPASPANKVREAKAIARFVRSSPQKARLVVDLIRGLRAEEALHRLRFTRKRIASDVAKLLQSAIANATDHGEMDVDALYVSRAFVNEGPRQKRIRPAPMGRAYRYQRRSCHIELYLAERGAAGLVRQVEDDAAPATPASAAGKTAARQPGRGKTAPGKSAGRKPVARKPAPKKPAAGKSAGKPAAAKKKAAAAPRKSGPKGK